MATKSLGTISESEETRDKPNQDGRMCEPARIVVAEDEESDLLLLKRALTKAGLGKPVDVARDGQELIDLLETSEREQSVLLLLDLKMPKVNGFEVLEWLNQQGKSRPISVVVLSSSAESADICRAGALGANGYMVKPHDPAELVRMMERINQFWTANNEPPAEPAQQQEFLYAMTA